MNGFAWLAIANEQHFVRIPRQRLGLGLLAAFRLSGRAPGLVSFAFVDDRRMRALHRQYLGIDEPTDVLSFPLDEGAEHSAVRRSEEVALGEVALGEVVVSTQTAARSAKELGHSATEELLLYAVHGVLHLLGFDDVTARKRAQMRAAERHCLARAGVQRDLFVRRRKEVPTDPGPTTMC